MSFSDILAKAVLSTSSDAIIAADKEGTIRFWNPGAERIFGYARHDAIGQSLDIIIPEIPPLACPNVITLSQTGPPAVTHKIGSARSAIL